MSILRNTFLAVATMAAAASAESGGAQPSPSPETTPGATAPAPARAPKSKSAEGSNKDAGHITYLSCERFLELPEDVRPLLIAWVAGQGYQRGTFDAWIMDVEKARRVMAAVDEECFKSPKASFPYKVEAEVAKFRR
jgi:hypothetical protein